MIPFLLGFTSCEREVEGIIEVIETEHKIDRDTTQLSRTNGSDTEENQNNLGVNMLVNGNLEKWVMFTSYDILEGWFCHNNSNMRKNHEKVYEGYYSARMSSLKSGSTARIDQRVGVIPGHRIRIRFAYYIEKWKQGGARTYCYFRTEAAEQYNISSDELKAFYGTDTYRIIRGGGYGRTYFPDNLNVWQLFDETIEVPPTAYYFVFGVNSYYGTTIYVDDCYVIDATEDISTGISPISM